MSQFQVMVTNALFMLDEQKMTIDFLVVEGFPAEMPIVMPEMDSFST